MDVDDPEQNMFLEYQQRKAQSKKAVPPTKETGKFSAGAKNNILNYASEMFWGKHNEDDEDIALSEL